MTDRIWPLSGVAAGASFTAATLKATDNTQALLVSAGAGGQIVADNTISWLGLMGMKIVCPGGGVTSVARFPIGTGTTAGRMTFYRYSSAYPTTNMQFAIFYNSAGTILFRFGVNTVGKLFIGGTTSTGTITEGQVMRYGVVFNQGTSTTTGSWTVNAYVGNSATPVATLTVSNANLGFGTPVDRVDLGTGVSVAITQTFWYPQISDTAGTELGPYTVSNVAPVGNAGADQATVDPYKTVTLTGSGTDSDGTIASYAWSKVSGPTPLSALSSTSAAAPTYFAAGSLAGFTDVWRLTVTDNGGATATDDVAITVLPVNERAIIGGVEVPMQIVAVTA
jgi:hypothetical protein